MRLLAACLVVVAWAGAALADGGRTAGDFQGVWRVSHWVGESQGGFSGPDPSTLLGSQVQITATAFRSSARNCRLDGAGVVTLGNREIETGLWGGQQIGQLRLSRTDIGKAFGRERTEVFEDRSLCVAAIMLDSDHILDVFGSGVIYELDRVK